MSLPSRLKVLAIVAAALLVGPAHGQDRGFRLDGLYPAGGRTTVTEAWGTLRFTVTNFDPVPRDLRVLVFYPEQPGVRYGRDVWVPAGSRLSAWVPVGPAPTQSGAQSREIRYLVYDRTDGEPRLIAGDERVGARAVPYRPREPTAVLLTDSDTPGADEALVLARTVRQERARSGMVAILQDQFLPDAIEAFDGTDQIIVAGIRLAADPVGRRAIRHWVEQGGTLWVLLDRVDPATVASILGDDRGFEVVGRTSLTSVRLLIPGEDPARVPVRDFDVPVPFVRVALGGSETVLSEVDGWPAAFAQPVGRGKVVVTTLGAPAWYRPRGPRDRASPFEPYPDLPVALLSLLRVGTVLMPEPLPPALPPDDLVPLATAEIGYSVLGRGTVALVLGGFALSLLAAGGLLRRARRPRLVGWLTPAASVVTAGVLVTLAVARREAIPPTTGVVAVLDVAPGTGEASASGVVAVFRPDSGPVELSTTIGGLFDLDPAGLEGQTRRRMQTDIGAWHWENLALPAGVRTGPFRSTVQTGPVRARAQFGPDGLTGHLKNGRLSGLADPVLLATAGGTVAVRLASDGTFASSPTDELPAGVFLNNPVLTDRQQRRQNVYRKLLTTPLPHHLRDRDLLFAWADPVDAPFTTGPEVRTVGSTLVAIPVEFDRPAVDERVTVPSTFIACSQIINGRPTRLTTESVQTANMRLRFRLPPSVVPLAVERVTFVVRIRASSRPVAVTGFDGKRSVPLARVVSPIDPVRVDVNDRRLVTPDADGFLYLGLEVGKREDAVNPGQAELDEKWRIESLTLEVVGRARR